MKRISLLGFVGLLGIAIAGCPIFGDGDGTGSGTICVGAACGCVQQSDCPANETCGNDGQCHSGDCTFTPCPSGYSCEVDQNSNTTSCVPTGSSSSSGGFGGSGGSPTTSSSSSSSSTSTSSTSSSSSSGSMPVYCGHPADCASGQICGASGTCVPGPCSAGNACAYGYTCGTDGTCQGASGSCDKDSDCSSGSICIAGTNGKGGTCTTPSNQCFDQSQCDSGDNCVAGKCVTACTSDSMCRDGYKCDTTKGVCSVIAQPCTVTSDCGSASKVCVGGACVPRSNGGTCPQGDVWDENGCVPNQGATFTCANDGVQDACATGSICLHHDCWISCDSPMQSACNNQPTLNTCKPVVDGSTTYNVCGTQQNLGSECGAGSQNNQMCTGGKVCIDGFCK